MKQKVLPRAIAAVIASAMVAAMPVTALAETKETVSISGKGEEAVDSIANTTGQPGIIMDDKKDGGETTVIESLDGSVTVKEDISVSNKNCEDTTEPIITTGIDIDSTAGKADIGVGGDVTIDTTANDKAGDRTYGIHSRGALDIEIGGDLNVTTKNAWAYGVLREDLQAASTMVIGGDIDVSSEKSFAYGANINSPTDLTVDGDIKVSGAKDISLNNTYGLLATAEGDIRIGGDVDVSGCEVTGIVISVDGPYAEDKNLDITVGGDVTASGTGIGIGIAIDDNDKIVNIAVEQDVSGSTYGIYSAGNDGEAHIVIGGTLSSQKDAAIGIYTSHTEEKAPDITVWKIESGTDQIVAAYSYDSENAWDPYKADTEYAAQVQASINYIIRADSVVDGKESSDSRIVLTREGGGAVKTVTVDDKTYGTGHQDDKIIINVEKGYKGSIENYGEGTLKLNDDGSYTLTIPEGGGVDLRAVLEKIEEQRRSSSDGDDEASDLIYYVDGKAVRLGGSASGWMQDANGWRYKKSNGSYAGGEWQLVEAGGRTDWYHFNAQGYVEGGWLTDTDGHRYYLYDTNDSRFGYMLTGWQQIDGQWYYFNIQSTDAAPQGALLTNTTTPDGYTVDATGARI